MEPLPTLLQCCTESTWLDHIITDLRSEATSIAPQKSKARAKAKGVQRWPYGGSGNIGTSNTGQTIHGQKRQYIAPRLCKIQRRRKYRPHQNHSTSIFASSPLPLIDKSHKVIEDARPSPVLAPPGHRLVEQAFLREDQGLVPHVFVDRLLPLALEVLDPPVQPRRPGRVPADGRRPEE